MLEKKRKEYPSDLQLHLGKNRLPLWSIGKVAQCATGERRLQRDREVEHPRRLASRKVSSSAPRTDSSLLQTPHNGVRFTTFLAQADTIEILTKGLVDFLSMLDFRPRFLNIRIARELLQQCPFLFVSRLLLWFASD